MGEPDQQEPIAAVETEGLAWGVRGSFRRYVLRIAHGQESLDGGVGMLPDGRYFFPLAAVSHFDSSRIDAAITFAGGVSFLGHAGFINLRLGELSLDLSSSRGMLRTTSYDGVRDLATVQVTDAWTDGQINGLVLASQLAAGAEELFGDVYAAETPFDDLEIRFAPPA